MPSVIWRDAMGMVDYGYYRGTFGGSMIKQSAFPRAMEEAEAVIVALLYPRTMEGLTAGQETLCRRALCYEAEYLAAAGSDGGVSSEKIGDCTVTYRSPSEKKTVSVNGREVSPTAVSLLMEAGLLVRWV